MHYKENAPGMSLSEVDVHPQQLTVIRFASDMLMVKQSLSLTCSACNHFQQVAMQLSSLYLH